MKVNVERLSAITHEDPSTLLGWVASGRLDCEHLEVGPVAQRFLFDVERAVAQVREIRAGGRPPPGRGQG